MTQTAPARVIVVGYDGSELSRAALRHAAGRAGEGGRLVVVHAMDPPVEWAGPGGLAMPEIYEQSLRHHTQHAERLLGSIHPGDTDGVPFETTYREGPPAKVLVAVADEQHADEIVVGSHGHGALRAVLGSVSHSLLHASDRPVVIIPQRALEHAD